MPDLPAEDAMSVLRSLLLLLGVAVVVGSCGVFDLGPCSTHVEPGIVVTIKDSVTGEPRAIEAVAVAHDGAFADTLRPAESEGGVLISRQGALERVGIYEVIVRVPGYQDWVRKRVMVSSNDCHVNRVELEARLQQ